MKKLLVLALVLIIPTFSNAEDKKEEKHEYKIITAEELKSALESENKPLLIDSRSAKYLGDGTIIKGAVVKTTDELTKEFLQENTKEGQNIVFYCSNVNCPASKHSAHKAIELGFKNIQKYPGGIDEWKEKKFPTDKIEIAKSK
ncbi:MAG: rhodanese-like domain-containing protein [Rickettsiales bacterium]|nr:rhodanese-like domain-containing protein [Rickettsiales bacterium]